MGVSLLPQKLGVYYPANTEANKPPHKTTCQDMNVKRLSAARCRGPLPATGLRSWDVKKAYQQGTDLQATKPRMFAGATCTLSDATKALMCYLIANTSRRPERVRKVLTLPEGTTRSISRLESAG